MSIYMKDFLKDKSKADACITKIDQALGFHTGTPDESKWVKFLEKYDIVIAPAEEHVGLAIAEWKDKPVSTIPTDTRTYNDVPGTFFAKGMTLNGTVIGKHIVFLNVNATSSDYTTMNFFAHELGHAIDWAIGGGAYHSSSAAFTTIYKKYPNLFQLPDMSQTLKDYLALQNEFFAECFAFYRTKTPISTTECGSAYFGKTLDAVMTPHKYLKHHCADIDAEFKRISKL